MKPDLELDKRLAGDIGVINGRERKDIEQMVAQMALFIPSDDHSRNKDNETQ